MDNKINFKSFMGDIKKRVYGAGEAASNYTKAAIGDMKSRNRVKKIVGKTFEKAGMSQSPENELYFKKKVKEKNKQFGL